MAVAIDAVSTSFASATATSVSCTITVGSGSNRVLIAEVIYGAAGTGIPAGAVVTYDPTGANQAMTLLTGTTVSNSAGISTTTALYGLVNPTSGASKAVKASGYSSQEVHIAAVAFTGADQTGGATTFYNGTTVNNTVATTSGSITVTSATGDMVVAVFAQNSANMVSTNGTLIGLENVGGNSTGLAAYLTGSASTNVTAAWGGTSTQNIASAVSIKAAAGGGGSTLVAPQLRGLIGRLKPQPFKPITLAPPGNPGTPTLVQHVGSTTNDNNLGSAGGNAFQFNMPNPTLAGNCLILTVSYPYSASRTILISDSNGDTWPAAAVTKGTASTSNLNTSIYVLPNASAGMHTLTVTFDATLKPFQYTLTEFYNVIAANPVDGTTGANSVTGSAANAGSFTPSTINNANGGHLIFSHAISNDTVGTLFANQASAITATNSASLLHADNTCTIPSASAYSIQAANGAINPGFAFTQTTGTNFVVTGIALKAGLAGTAPAAGIRIIRLLHATLEHPQTGNNAILFPCDGNLRVATMAAGNNLNVVNSNIDSNGTYTVRTNAAGESQVFELANQSANNANVLTQNLNASEIQYSIHLFDIIGADPSPFMNTSGFNGSAPGSGTVFNDFPDHTPNANVAGLTIAQTGMGTAGPQFGFASGAPAGAIFDVVFYTGMTDADQMDNADPFGHVYFSTNTAQTWNWNLGAAGHGSTAFATAISYKAAGGTTAYTLAGAEGAFTISGQAATTAAARKIAGAEGSFTISGQAAVLSHGLKLAGAEGAFTISGQAATELRGIKLGGAEGAFVISGQSATLTLTTSGHFTLAGDEGAFTISGQSATLAAARKIAGAEGAFTISGQAAGMLRGIKMPGVEGSFTISGQSATELRGIKMPGVEGSFTISGQAGTRNIGMPGAEGAFTISGQSAKFPVALSLQAVKGTFTINGPGASLVYTPAGGGPPVSHSNQFIATTGPMTGLP